MDTNDQPPASTTVRRRPPKALLLAGCLVLCLAFVLVFGLPSLGSGRPYGFLAGLTAFKAGPYASSAKSTNGRPGVVLWAYTGQADFEAVYAAAKRELLRQGWHEGPNVLPHYRSFSYRPEGAGMRDDEFGHINLWRDKRMEPNPIFQGKPRMNVAQGWVTVDCSERRSPSLWEKLRNGLRRTLGL
jgi:hypothetical protein